MLLRPRNILVASIASASMGLGLGASSTAGAVLHATPFHPLISLASPAHARFGSVQSNNWSGYDQGLLDTTTLVTSVSGEWTIPTATQHTSGEAESSATWVGVGGGCVDMTSGCLVTDPTLIQAGTEQDVDASGAATYSAWWEILPLPSTTASIPVSAGDHVKVTISGPLLWTITFQDLTNGQGFTQLIPYVSTMDSVEWVEEAPVVLSVGSSNPVSAGEAALPRLSSPAFDHAMVNGSPAHLSAAYEMQMVDSSGNVLATPSAPAPDGDGFNVCTYAASCAAPSS